MVSIILCAIFLIFTIYRCKEWIIYQQKENDLFNATNALNFETIILFSNYEITRRVLEIIKKTGKGVRIQCGNSSWLLISNDVCKDELLSKLELIQDVMIYKRYHGKNENFVKDNVDQILFDTWIDYGYRQNYRTILKREMANLLNSGEISNATYNEMYRRAYLFERLN